MKAGTTKPQAGHVEAVTTVLCAQCEDPLEIQTSLLQVAPKGVVDQRPRENIVAGRHRGMGGKQGSTGNRFQRRFKAKLRTHHGVSATLKDLECGMALIDVPDRRLQVQGFQNPGTANAKQHFLADTSGLVATI